jgi:short-chain fatty acids transporter
LLTALLGWGIAGEPPARMAAHWAAGLWGLLEFSMQMCLVLMTGQALAESPPVRRLLGRLAALPKSGRGAVALVAAVACLTGVIHWGLGLLAGALVARDTAVSASRRGVRVHYPLLGTAGYLPLLVWHGGLSGSAPLAVATQGHFLAGRIGVVPVAATLGSPMNLAVLACLLLLLPWIVSRLHPSDPARCQLPPLKILSAWAVAGRADGRAPVVTVGGEPGSDPSAGGASASHAAPGARIGSHPALALVLGGVGLAWALQQTAGRAIADGALGLDLNILNLLFLSLGVLFHGRLGAYAQAFERAAGAAAGIILQFPLYAGILGMIRGSGLLEAGAGALAAISTRESFPILAFLSACVVNVFVPSGGGQWAVQGPILIEAAQRLGASVPKTVLALAYGDQCTNMIQPFWVLPLLGIMRLRAQEVLGYASVLMFVTFPLFILALWLLPA